ncbi:MAG: LPP20 family lipoprotein [Spirochaetales bacterium]|nr:LPP20 family lipoprotein [Spirochaetales bacterium]
MKKLFVLLMMAIVAFGFVSCGSEPETTEETVDKKGLDVPDWFLTPPQADNMIYGIGVDTRSDMARAKDIAASRARADIAKQLSVTVETMLTDYFQEAGEGDNKQAIEMIESITKEVAQVDLTNAILKETYPVLEKNDEYTMYVLVEFDKNKAVEENVAEIFERNESAAFAEFKAQQALERLNAELDNNPPASTANEG